MTAPRVQTSGRSEFAVAGFFLALGLLVLWDASQINTGLVQTGPVGPRAMPLLVGGLLGVCAVALTVDLLRGGRAEIVGGGDIDIRHSTDRRTVLLLLAVFLANIALIDTAGWWLSGAVLFWGAAYALGSRRYARDAATAFGLSFGTYYLFAGALGIALPAGVLQGIL